MATPTLSEMRDRVIARSAEDAGFRDRLIADPKTVVWEEFGAFIPEGFDVQVHEDSATTAHFILPPPSRLTEADLAMVAGADWRTGGEGGP
ncbi:MAG: NHLP leader peptide family RiPP precursor [Chloroflexi bacterium]|nr:NHLP leader peptide family RiPP precursor [Chloroflexota bacterium]